MSRTITVLGSGISGMGAAILAKKKGYDVFLSEYREITNHNKRILLNHEISWEEGGHKHDRILSSHEVVKSPGIADESSIIKKICSQNIPIISEIEFAFRYTKAKIAAITGTNGKTTTSKLLGHVLKNAGYDVLVAGNVGVGFSSSIAERDYDYIILEVSSFQLDGIKEFSCHVAIILNINSDHLDRYEYKLNNYMNAKFQITKNQTSKDFLIFNIDDELVNKIQTDARKLPISLTNEQDEGGYLKHKDLIIKLNNQTMTIQELALQGKHNLFNSMAAAMAARVFEVKDNVIRQSMIDFQNLEHRLENVLTVHGINFINDSKATNVNACWFALESMQQKVVWIVGGVDKGNDYSYLEELVIAKVKAIVCLGKNNQEILKSFHGKVDTIVQASSMQEAVNQSFSLADKGDSVLLSPACASFDMFLNYEDRGFQFKKTVRAL